LERVPQPPVDRQVNRRNLPEIDAPHKTTTPEDGASLTRQWTFYINDLQ